MSFLTSVLIAGLWPASPAPPGPEHGASPICSIISTPRAPFFCELVISGMQEKLSVGVAQIHPPLKMKWKCFVQQTMHSRCHGLLNKDGLQATASAGYVSRHSPPNYLHQFSLKPVLSTAAWVGARPASDIREDISDSWRHFELKISESNSFLGFDLHRGHEVFIAFRHKLKLSRPALD